MSTIASPLQRSAERLEAKQPLLIVAVGSSSTAGTGASGPDKTYPSQLQVDLRRRYPGADLTVLNRGKGGEDAGEELARLDRDVVAAHPDLVIWQLGTNAVLRRDDLDADAGLMERGVEILKSDGIDVVLMDMQFAPRVLNRPAYPAMEQLIADTAQQGAVGLYRRFDVMRYWQADDRFPAGMTAADGLHMTDASYACLGTNLADALAANWEAVAKSHPRPSAAPAAVAGLAPR
jgi:lysophospholipase L1-like esterase